MMEQNSSTVCFATVHSDEPKSTRLSSDDAMPLYATVMPSSTRKARLHQDQATKLTQQSHQPASVCGGNKALPITLEHHRTSKVDDVKDNEHESTSGESDNETIELWSNEIPVWIKGEQRWISGVTEQTSCLDLVEALLMDEGVIKATNDNNNNSVTNLYPTKVNDYVIVERWRRVEQILDPRTKILKIWTAWGAEQSEVKFTLKRRSDSHHSSSHHQIQSQGPQTAGDRDSGRGSPTGSINSAIVRRRRHRASRSTFAWMTHGQTIHPKSQKNSIERLMKLILEQGEVIQLQLAKLRDRELEISTIEEERHKVREKEHGKNYLLETYLKGIADSDEKQELAAGNSDSGVHTEETAASPVVEHEDEISDTLLPLNQPNTSSFKAGSKKRRSKREHELMLEHQSTKEYSSAIKDEKKSTEARTSSSSSSNKESIDSEVAAQIDILEKLIVLNKHLQREEELCVRLSAKIKRYEADASGLSEAQVKDSLSRVNEQLDEKNYEIAEMEGEIKTSDEALTTKTDLLKQLYDELEEAEVEQRKSEATGTPNVVSMSVPPPLPPLKMDQLLSENKEELNMSHEYLAENIYNISKIILKNSGPPLPTMPPVMSQQTSADFVCHTPDSPLTELQPISMLNQQIYQMPNASAGQRIIQAQIHTIPTTAQQQSHGKYEQSHSMSADLLLPPLNQHHQQWDQSKDYNEAMRVSMNYLATINQRIQKSNHIDTDINNANNPIMQATQYKLGPKKLLINTQVINSNLHSVNENRSNIYKPNLMLQPNDVNYGIDLAGDSSQLGTLV